LGNIPHHHRIPCPVLAGIDLAEAARPGRLAVDPTRPCRKQVRLLKKVSDPEAGERYGYYAGRLIAGFMCPDVVSASCHLRACSALALVARGR